MVTEKSLLSSTGFFDIRKDELFEDILAYSGIPKNLFPEIVDCGQLVGTITSKAARELGISTDALIVTGAMDQITGAIGAGNTSRGIVTETTGTALVVGATTNAPDFSHPARPIIYRHAWSGYFFVLTLANTAGIILKWFKDNFCESEVSRFGDSVYVELDRLAQAVPCGSEGLLVFPHFSGMATPTADSETNGIFYGITLNTRKAHFIRAIMESVSYILRESIDIFEQMGLRVDQIRSLGGGSNSQLWEQIKADVVKREIVTLMDTESASIGAAMLGVLGAGWYPTLESIGVPNPPKDIFIPNKENTFVYDECYKKFRGLYQCHVAMRSAP